MKRLIVCFFLILGIYFCKAQDKQAILKTLETQRLAWNRGDIPGFMKGYWQSDSLLFVGSSGPKYGWQNTLDNYKKGYPDKAAMGQLIFKVLKVELIDKANAFMLGSWQLIRQKDTPGGYFTLWFRKINGEWKVVVDHTS